jgi:hypothetical protein
MLCKAPRAAGPKETVGRALATPDLHGAVRSGTAGCGPNRDHGQRAGPDAEATHRRMHISAPPAAGPFGNSVPRAGRRSCVTQSGPTRLRVPISAPPAAGPARAASGLEELRDSERSHGCQRDTLTVCFQYLVPQVTVSDDSTCYSESAQLHSESGAEVRALLLEL